MNSSLTFLLVFLSLLLFFLIDINITGSVVSESCCFAPNCAAENQCSEAQTSSNLDFTAFSYAGMLILSFLFIFFYLHNKK